MTGYWILGITGLFFIFLLILIIKNVEIRNYLLYRLSPKRAKNITFVKLHKDNQLVYILGTIHGAHLSTRDYSLWHVEAVINNLCPDLVLVESRPEELEQDYWADGPLEMLFSSLTAKKLGIPVYGMDWWDLDLLGVGRSNNIREDKMFEHITHRISGRRRILIITGFSHVPEFSMRFKNIGYSCADFPTAEKEKLFAFKGEERLYPAGMALYLEKRVELDKKTLAEADNPKLRLALDRNIRFLIQFLQDVKAQEDKQMVRTL